MLMPPCSSAHVAVALPGASGGEQSALVSAQGIAVPMVFGAAMNVPADAFM